jgi:predicted glycoside hydrolase/deacetylase ChbG (UPF0249 family)
MTVVAILAALLFAPRSAFGVTSAEKLGYAPEARVVILGVSTMGWTYESNAAVKEVLETAPEGVAADVMVVGPWFEEVVTWRRDNMDADVGVSLTLLSEGDAYRYGPAGHKEALAGLMDENGYLPGSLRRLELNASPEAIEHELRAQIDRCLKAGIRPTHLMTHKGVLFARHDLAEIYLRLAQEYWIPAVVVELSPQMLEEFERFGLPMDPGMVELIGKYPLPKLDELRIVPDAESYEAKRTALLQMIATLPPGLTQIHFRPAEESNALKRLTPRWQQMVWDAELLKDPEVRKFLAESGVVLTDWREVMQRFEGTLPTPVLKEDAKSEDESTEAKSLLIPMEPEVKEPSR